MAEVRVSVTPAASATLNMSVMTGAFSLTLTSHTLPPSSTGSTSCESVEVHVCRGEERVSVRVGMNYACRIPTYVRLRAVS